MSPKLSCYSNPYCMVTQQADSGPNPDLRSAKVGVRPAIGPSLFSGRELTV